jgi:hypothetical protein
MARSSGFSLRHRWSDWLRHPFTSDSTAQVVVYQRER